MGRPDGAFIAELLQRGMSRRAFMTFCAAMTATLALPATYVPRVAAAVAAAPRLPVIWLRGQGCGGDGEALFRVANPTIAELLLQFLSIDYLETLMFPSGPDAGRALESSMSKHREAYLAIVEGAIPMADDGAWWTVGGQPLRDLVRRVSADAAGTIAVGSCAFDGGLSAAAGGASGAVGVGQVASGPLVSLPGCPVNPWNLAATIVHYLTFSALPATDAGGRPLFAYGPLVHNECERRAHFEFGEFVLDWGDEGAQKGWCLYKMGCKGPETFANCASVGFDGGTSWPVKAGAGCLGCTMPAFWDAMSPFTRRLPAVPFVPGVTVDQAGQLAVGGIAGVAGLHAVGSFVRAKRQGAAARRLTGTAASAPAESLSAADTEALPAMPEPNPAVDATTAPVPELASNGDGRSGLQRALGEADDAAAATAVVVESRVVDEVPADEVSTAPWAPAGEAPADEAPATAPAEADREA